MSRFITAIFFVQLFFFFQAEDGIRDLTVTGVQTCALPIYVDLATMGGFFQIPATTSLDITPLIEITSVTPSLIVATRETATTPKMVTVHISNRSKASISTSIDTTVAVDNPQPKRAKGKATPVTIGPEETRELNIKLDRFETTSERRTVSLTSSSTAPPTPDPSPAATGARFLFRTSDKSSNEVAVPIVYADAHVAPSFHVGYIRGFDFSLPNALSALGVDSKEFSVDEVKTAHLSKFTSVIVDNRVYES